MSPRRRSPTPTLRPRTRRRTWPSPKSRTPTPRRLWSGPPSPQTPRSSWRAELREGERVSHLGEQTPRPSLPSTALGLRARRIAISPTRDMGTSDAGCWRGGREDAPVGGANQSSLGRGVIGESEGSNRRIIGEERGMPNDAHRFTPACEPGRSDGYNGITEDLSVYGGSDTDADQLFCAHCVPIAPV